MDIVRIGFPYGDHRNNLESTVQVPVRLSHKYLSSDLPADFVDSLERIPNNEYFIKCFIIIKSNMSTIKRVLLYLA